MNKKAKASPSTYQKIHRFYAFKYETDAKIIEHVRTWYGMKFTKEHMLKVAKNNIEGERREYYEKLYNFINNLNDAEIKDINKYWVRIDSKILI